MSQEMENETKVLSYNIAGKPDIADALKNGVRVIPVEIEDQMKEAYLGYAMSVIVGRALPDVRDGLKPVHRRILHAMNERAWRSDRPYVKCAKIVGEVIGNYHPHGDASVYEALVRMVQEFSLRVPLIDGQGNFGSIDGDNPAAYRYTEARLEKVAEELLRDIEKETVSFSPNYDDTKEQPDVLPANFPNLLVNGSSGIAVGMATNIPPHNLKETIDAVIAVIRNPEITIPEILKIIPGPDFPTSGIIIGGEGLISAYSTGKGSIRIRSKVEIEEKKNGREVIVVTEIPYQVNKKVLLEKIGDLVNEKQIEGISEILDLSDRKGIRVEIHIKKDANAQVILNQLYKMTQLQVSYGITMLAILDNKPKIFNIKEILTAYSAHRREVIVRRTQFDLDKAEKRAHILEGLKIALENIEDVIKVIRASKNPPEAKQQLMVRFSLSEVQSDAILEMRLQRLTSLEVQKIIDELEEVRKLIIDLKDILAKPSRVNEIVCTELQEVGDKYGNKRKTEISIETIESSSFNAEDLIADEEIVIQITYDQFIKRLPIDTFKRQKRGGKGIQGLSQKRDDVIKIMKAAMTHDNIMFFSNIGKVYVMKAYELPIASKEARGKSLKAIINLREDEYISSVFTFRGEDMDKDLLLVTRKGFIKRIQLKEFGNVKKSGIIAIGLREGDELIKVESMTDKDEVMIFSKKGLALRIEGNIVRAQGRTASGVTGMRLAEDDSIVGLSKYKEGEDIFVVSEEGYGKRLGFEEFAAKGRGGKGMAYLKITEKNGFSVGTGSVGNEDEIILITQQGMTIRINAFDISKLGRTAVGVRIVDLKDNDKVQDFTVLGEN
ncbi:MULTISPECIES: DNA gyrase subunit A [Leptospira]|uniref:DNA gyrase subunit A n=2 Tax=Leptospira kirschneri TaxID=29507 RepID=A0A1T1DGU6_9LEPT|nr:MULTISPECIES: DNA gyrase subunit A [Leptospira]EJO69584.1 DNA gyrase, A subunit [Leptospira kirschneri serovar Grippotyphosa str. RM52]EKO53367.1 DNA gyrase, A subunit [Leptospira kirschneri str. 200802841]EKP06285.1 DNA gyrase, A subunit [Leptospira kirschneri str. 2008720114]EKQ83437.1 DNA gyrase, A subunit [Leptospira kirschneri serovar Grippotyphosa str. Moskva]EKR09135.1 DNA gyrase, A subunit [Leptospira kirschneri serovar Valbuzzi str. 200702274]